MRDVREVSTFVILRVEAAGSSFREVRLARVASVMVFRVRVVGSRILRGCCRALLMFSSVMLGIRFLWVELYLFGVSCFFCSSCSLLNDWEGEEGDVGALPDITGLIAQAH